MSYVEHIAKEYLEKKGYLVTSRIRYQVPKEVSGKKVSGWYDIDILAVNDEEALIIECRSYYREKTIKKEVEEVQKRFKWAFRYRLKNMPLLRNKEKRRIYLSDYSSSSIRELFEKEGIEAIELRKWLVDFLKMLKEGYDATGGKVGKEEDMTTRTLMCLIDHELIEESVLNE